MLSFQRSFFFTVGCLHMFSIHKVKMAVDKHRKQHLHFPAANIGFWSLRKEEKFLGLNFIDSLRQDSEKRSKLEEKLLNNNPFDAMFSTTKKNRSSTRKCYRQDCEEI